MRMGIAFPKEYIYCSENITQTSWKELRWVVSRCTQLGYAEFINTIDTSFYFTGIYVLSMLEPEKDTKSISLSKLQGDNIW